MTKLIAAFALTLSLAACGKGGDKKLGVPECDAYLDKMAACATKVGGPTGEQLTKMRNMMADAWSKESNDKASLAGVCTGAIKDMKKQVPNCEW